MKIVAPINGVEEAEKLIQAGADELYCGVIDENWRQKYPKEISPNRRSTQISNLNNFSELTNIVAIAHRSGVKVQFCVNGFFHVLDIERQIDLAIEAGVDRFVVSTLPTLFMVLNKKFSGTICVSSGAAVFNSQVVRFYRELGANVVILPRDVSVEDINSITWNNPNTEFEIFIKNEGCRNVGSFCNFGHLHREPHEMPLYYQLIFSLMRKLPRSKPSFDSPVGFRQRIPMNFIRNFIQSAVIKPCQRRYRVFCANACGRSDKNDLLAAVQKYYSQPYEFLDVCGACILPQILSRNVSFCKIVGRGHLTEWKIKDVLFIKAVLETLKQNNHSLSEKYQQIQQVYKRIYGYSCNNNCYYGKQIVA